MRYLVPEIMLLCRGSTCCPTDIATGRKFHAKTFLGKGRYYTIRSNDRLRSSVSYRDALLYILLHFVNFVTLF